MNFKRNVLILAVLILCAFTLIIVAIYPLILYLLPPFTSDNSIISQQTCSLPCWRGLTLGTSTKNDVYAALRKGNFVPDALIDEELGLLNWHWSLLHSGHFGFNADDILISAEIYPNSDYSASAFINQYGEPAALASRLDSTGTSFNLKMTFYYPEFGLTVYFISEDVDPNSDLILSPDAVGIGFGWYHSSDSLREFISKTRYFEPTYLDEFIDSELTLGWPGFGSLAIVRPDQSIILHPLIFVTTTPSANAG